MANYTIENLINDSVRVHNGMIIVYPQYNNAEDRINFEAATFNGNCYASNNGTLAYVIEGVLYVTPATKRAYKALKNFSSKNFYVPFSNGDYPKQEKQRWEQLRDMQRKVQQEEFVHDCNEYCDKHNIGILDESILERCLVMPKTGVKVKHLYYETVYYPVINQTFFDCTIPDHIGKFCTNNGRVVFVYRDGTTRVTKGYWILDALREAGYREAGLFVPFSNGEEILNLALRTRWEKISK